jgi:hypothetical protein
VTKPSAFWAYSCSLFVSLLVGCGSSHDGDILDFRAEDTLTVPSTLADPRAYGERSEIVSIALAEEGRGPNRVGDRLRYYPFALGRYLGPREAWCSEFVSWAYKSAGLPFSGGGEGGWMLRGSRDIKSWFERRGTWVSRWHRNWHTFTVKAGDFIRYENDNGGHSGIVRFESGRDLYTVEGNVGDRVQLRIIRNWRDRTDIDGIGRR